MRILGIDYGTVRCGLAITDAAGITAQPLKTLEPVGVEDFVLQISRLVDEEDVKVVVIGRPLAMSGEPSEFTKEVDGATDSLKEALSVPVEVIDERLTSKASDRELQSYEKDKRDIRAAQLILESYLEQK